MTHPAAPPARLVRSVLAGRSRGVFQGRIEVARAAQKTDGYQMNQTLLLSPDAESDSKPELEIFADDVKCSHGATVGELDAEQLFYLRSRGIPVAEARAILVGAFLQEVLETAEDDGARAMLETAVAQWPLKDAAMMDVTAHPPGFPDPVADHPRQALRVPRQRRLGAEAAGRDRCDVGSDGDPVRQRPSRPALDERAHHRRLRGRPRACPPARRPRRGRRSCSSRNSTEAINLVAHSYGRHLLRPGQAVLICEMEHHSNIVPWQLLRDDHGIELRVAPVTDQGELDMAAYEALLADGRVGLVAITHM